MALVHIDRTPPPSVLRWFGLSVLAASATIGALLFLRFDARVPSAVVAGCGSLYALVYYSVAKWRRALYLGWMFATAPISFCLSHAVLLTIYYGLVTPLGLALRAFGHDPLRRRRPADPSESLWVKSEAEKPLERYFYQY